MSLSREETRRRPPLMTARRWVVVAAGFVLFVLVAAVLYVHEAGAAYRDEERNAIAIAREQAGLVDIGDAEVHTWDEKIWIVTGRDADGTEWFVWERPEGLVKERAADGLTRQAMADRFAALHPDCPILRMLPAWFQNQPAWEIRYMADSASKRQAIDFYAFKDGTKLQTLELPQF